MSFLRNAFYSAKHTAYETGINLFARDRGVRDFESTGQLTPQEFVEAGNYLCELSPLWKWQAAPNGARTGPLPHDESFLMYRGAPCRRTVAQTDEFRDVDAGADAAQDDVPSTDSEDSDVEGLIVHTHSDAVHHIYDVSLTYSQPHHTPQIFFSGYTADRSRTLTDKEMQEDVCTDYFGVDKTVTIENHPFLDVRSISVHPCRHAESLKRQVDRARNVHNAAQQSLPEGEREPFAFQTHASLVLFLKFISGVTPTIQYDTTPEFIF